MLMMLNIKKLLLCCEKQFLHIVNHVRQVLKKSEIRAKFGTCKCGNIYSEKLPHPSEEGEPDEHGKVRYKCIPVLCGNWKQVTGNLLIAEGENFVEALRSGAFLTCIYEGKITVIGIPEKEAGNECIIVDDWLRLYTKPTVEGKGRDVFRHENAKLYDWAMPEELKDNISEKGVLPKNCRNVTGILQADLTSNNLYIDLEERYWVAVGPNVMNPEHNENSEIKEEEMHYGTKLDIVVLDEKTATEYYIPAVVGDVKEHSKPDGLYQTGVPYDVSRPTVEGDGSTIIYRIMLHPKSFFSGLIQVANPMHPDAVTSGCDRGGSTTS